MKRIIQIAAAVVLGCLLATPLSAQVKTKKVKIGKSVCYEGEVLKKTPAGKGTLYINQGYTSEIRIKGDFDGNNVSNAEIKFDSNGISFKGEVSHVFTNKTFQLTLTKGKFYNGDRDLGKIQSPATISFDCNYAPASFNPTIVLFRELRQEAMPLLKWAKYFAGSSNYKIKNPDLVKCILNSKGLYYKELTREEKYQAESESRAVAVFDNGVVCPLHGSKIKWKRPNGDFVIFDKDSESVDKYEITGKNSKIRYERSGSDLCYTFSNGNTIDGCAKNFNIPQSFKEVMSPSFELACKWEADDIQKYFDCSIYCHVTYSDGTYYRGQIANVKVEGDKLAEQSYYYGTLYDKTGQKIEEYVNGISDTERAAIEKKEAEKAEAERKAKEKADNQIKQRLYKKYGKQYVDMILNSGGEKIVVGMPIALLKEFDGTRVLGVLLELTLKRDNGNSQRYHLFAARPDTEWYGTNVGYFWVEGGKITSISYNQ